MTRKLRVKYVLSLIFISIFIANGVLAVEQFPAFPMAFIGAATLNGNNLAVGTKIQAFNADVLKGETTIVEAGIYGSDNPVANKLLVSSYASGTLVFKYILPGESTANTGNQILSYNGSFVSGGSTVHNLAFIKTIVVPPQQPSGGGGGGGVQTPPVIPPAVATTTATSSPITPNNQATVTPRVLGEKITDNFAEFIATQKNLLSRLDTNLAKRLAGKILLQVQDHGEAWYVDLISLKRFYLADGARAYGALRRFGLGITNKDLAKIPVGIEKRFLDTDTDGDGLADKLEEGLGTDKNKVDTDGDGVNDYTEVITNQTNPLGAGKLVYDNKLIGRLKGRIVLQIESRGEAWYVNPADGKRYYMKDGDAAYQIMRFLSLGITNENLRKISIGD